MNFITKASGSDIFLRMLFEAVDNMLWKQFDLRVSFKGRKILRELGGGHEAREFKVEVLEKKEIEYLSPREIQDEKYQKKLDFDHQKRLKGGKKNSENWARKRRMKEYLESKK